MHNSYGFWSFGVLREHHLVVIQRTKRIYNGLNVELEGYCTGIPSTPAGFPSCHQLHEQFQKQCEELGGGLKTIHFKMYLYYLYEAFFAVGDLRQLTTDHNRQNYKANSVKMLYRHHI